MITPGDILVLAVLSLIVGLVIAQMRRDRKKGNHCGGCKGCAGLQTGCTGCPHGASCPGCGK